MCSLRPHPEYRATGDRHLPGRAVPGVHRCRREKITVNAQALGRPGDKAPSKNAEKLNAKPRRAALCRRLREQTLGYRFPGIRSRCSLTPGRQSTPHPRLKPNT